MIERNLIFRKGGFLPRGMGAFGLLCRAGQRLSRGLERTGGKIARAVEQGLVFLDAEKVQENEARTCKAAEERQKKFTPPADMWK